MSAITAQGQSEPESGAGEARRARVAVLLTEYWENSHADVFVSKLLDGCVIDGVFYPPTLDVVSFYVDHFPETDMSRDIAAAHRIPIFSTPREALLVGSDRFDLDGVIIIGELGEYPVNERDQILYPRRQFFDATLEVMLEFDRTVPVFTDKGFAVTAVDIDWVYEQVRAHDIPFFSSSSLPFTLRLPSSHTVPSGAPVARAFGIYFSAVERYVYHAAEMVQSIVEKRARGESGVVRVAAYEGGDAVAALASPAWRETYGAVVDYLDLGVADEFSETLARPVFTEVTYADGLIVGLLFADRLVDRFVSAFQMSERAEPVCVEFFCEWQKPHVHSAYLVLEIERFIHTARSPVPLKRSLITTGVTDAVMRSLHAGTPIETPQLTVTY